jgi:beta-glucosidase
MREALHRQLYNFANSAAMNGLTSTSKIVTVRTWYENALLAATIVSAIILVGSGALVVTQAFGKKEED